MTDREMLDLAAKAGGIELGGMYRQDRIERSVDETRLVPWNPLTDDGDEARLEAALRLSVRWGHTCVVVGEVKEHYADHANDRQAARRRAGVRAAAEIGRAS